MGDGTRQPRFKALYAEHLDAVARYAARRVVAGDVHDIVSETFLVAWRRLDDVPEDALPWLFGTARRVIANRRRSAGRRRALVDKLAADPSLAWPEDADAVDERLLAAIARLPDAEREAFLLVAWDGLDPSRAAAAAGCGPGAFRMRLHRARAELKRQLVTTLEESR